MTGADVAAAVNSWGVLVLTALLVVGFGRTLWRAWAWHRAGYTIPDLLPRDLLVVGSFAFTLLALLAVRALVVVGAIGSPRDDPLYAIVTVGAANLGAVVYCYFEFRVIGRRPPR